MHIGIVGPIATEDIAHLMDGDTSGLPKGYSGGPLLVTLISEFLRCDHQVSAFTLSNDMPLKSGTSVTARGVRFSLSYSPMRPRAWRPNGRFPGRILDLYQFEIGELQSAIARAGPDIVHAHWLYEFARAAVASKIPHVVTCHDSPYRIAKMASNSRPTRSLYRWLRTLMARRVLREAHYITAVSPYMRDEVQALATPRITVVPNPVDNLALSLFRQRKAPPVPRIAMVCNGWDARKNPEPGLQAFAELRSDMRAAELHLFGSDFGPREKAEHWCSARGIGDGMVFHGSIPHFQLLKALAEFDMLLHPSIEESFGMSIAEGMAMGLPVVAGEASGAVPWVVGNTGALCDVRQVSSILNAMRKVLVPENYIDHSMNGHRRIEAMFTVNAVAKAYLETYHASISSGGRS